MCSRCAYVPVLCKMLEFKYHETQTIFVSLYPRKRQTCYLPRKRVKQKSEATKHEAETRNLISGHTREISMLLPGREQRMGSKHGFRMNRFFIRKIFILHYSMRIGDNNKHNSFV